MADTPIDSPISSITDALTPDPEGRASCSAAEDVDQIEGASQVVEKVLAATTEDCGAPFEPDALYNLKVLKEHNLAYFQRIRSELKKLNKNVSLVALDQALKDKTVENLAPETHHGYACALLDKLTIAGNPPVGVEGKLLVFNETTNLWTEETVESLSRQVAESHDGLGNCKRSSDYNAVANLAISLATDPEFFKAAPIGLACPDGFLSIQKNKISTVPLNAAHRQRVMIAVTPKQIPTPLFDDFLSETFASEKQEEVAQQIRLLQEVLGGIMLGTSAKYQKATLFFDPFGRAGKGTVERLLRQLVPTEFITAVSPFGWNSEYYLASLAGARLNVVGELPDDKPIPAAAFKTVTGGDLLTGRHPTHRPFTFHNSAGHIFMSNHFINTRDHSEAFFARWILVEFPNSRLRSGKPIDPGLADRITTAELPGIAHWALIGARRILKQGGYSNSIVHDRLLRKWRRSTNSVLEFIHEACQQSKDYKVKRSEFYTAYKAWCGENGRRPYAKGKVKEMLAYNINLRIHHATLDGYEIFRGVRLKNHHDNLGGQFARIVPSGEDDLY